MAVFLAILPKCPFCIVAYSSTMVLCSGETLPFNLVHASPLTLAITGVLGLITLGCILLSFRGRRTIFAFLLALAGVAMVFYSVAGGWAPWLYYGGIGVVVSGIWLNAGFMNDRGEISSLLPKN